MKVTDIKTRQDLQNFTHWKNGDGIAGEGTIEEIAFIDDAEHGKHVVFFHENGIVGSIKL